MYKIIRIMHENTIVCCAIPRGSYLNWVNADCRLIIVDMDNILLF